MLVECQADPKAHDPESMKQRVHSEAIGVGAMTMSFSSSSHSSQHMPLARRDAHSAR